MKWWQFNGYGFYIWGSYLVAAAAIAIEAASLAARRARALRAVEESDEIGIARAEATGRDRDR